MHSKISGIPYSHHAAVPMDPATQPEHFVVRQGKIRSTREAFDEGKCLLYTEAGRYYFLIPTGKTDSNGDPVFDDYLTFPSRTDAQRWLDRAEAHEAALYLDGEPIMYGDRDSIAVIFNNLAGRNFADDPEKYRSYLEYMSRELHADWAPGRELGWRLGQQSGYQSKFEFPAAPICAKRLAP